jgi:uncharacterized membrane protein
MRIERRKRMPRYRILGTHERTGADVATTVSARDEEAAEEIARSRGIVISLVRPMDGVSNETLRVAARMAAKPAKPPNYSVLRVGSVVLLVIAALLLIGGVVTMVEGLIDAFSRDISILNGFNFMTGCWMIVAGASVGVLGGIAAAVRDIARHSFKSNSQPGQPH